MDAAEAATDPWWAPTSPHHWGPRFRTAALHGLIEPVGYAANRRPTARQNIVRVWRGVPRQYRAVAS